MHAHPKAGGVQETRPACCARYRTLWPYAQRESLATRKGSDPYKPQKKAHAHTHTHTPETQTCASVKGLRGVLARCGMEHFLVSPSK